MNIDHHITATVQFSSNAQDVAMIQNCAQNNTIYCESQNHARNNRIYYQIKDLNSMSQKIKLQSSSGEFIILPRRNLYFKHRNESRRGRKQEIHGFRCTKGFID